ncbi:autotransporter outer membrane beta-barrel domain-containing protein [Novosphingobium album (ex Hu et al. 2023)]|uniref:Autotransporter outer membrane beta-barrel domain-containing protein n=1 Tax=Novosphingobium album (ex Hu et al. 2023) TaxID=2930093 RepID=A0ABT0B687_9SPHN|nr:autotransporter outer membrane beta-barrel domain-containing protein [Novosphingobium album (ex Hu et al. 2023)]MCJ2180542.1 autotransporter outer membrane beta-barrel domain-containing protein [Novosphingobium album (ex Hu et al. 2023)]
MMALFRAGPWLLAAAAAATTLPAQAQEADSALAPTTAAAPNDTTDATLIEPLPLWTVAASTGISNRDDGPDGTWEALSLTRQLGRGYVRGALMRYHGTLLQADTALPSDYLVGTVAAGGNFSGWVTDGWLSLGRQDYGKISTPEGSRSSTGATGSTYFAIGGDFGKVLPLGHDWYLTPTATASYAHGKLLRPAPTETTFKDVETDEPTWSLSAAVRLDHAFGPGKRHYAGISVSRNWTSNAVSAVYPVSVDDETGTVDLASRHYADNWFEAGVTANMELTPTLHLDVFATRGTGMSSGNTTSAGISLRKSF